MRKKKSQSLKVLSALFLSAFLSLNRHLVTDSFASDTDATMSPRIVGGEESQAGKYPFITALVSRGSSNYQGQMCGASLIGAKWVLTAAHCVHDQTASELAVAVGAFDLLNDGTPQINVKNIIVHPNYDTETQDNDIALLELESSSAQPVVQVVSQDSAQAGVMGVVMGWGLTDGSDDNSYVSRLREVSVPVVSNSTCQSALGSENPITQNMLCAGYASGGKDSCQGDSGGPFLVMENGKYKQAGVVSWGVGCADANSYGVYARVYKYISFLKQYVPEVANDDDDTNDNTDTTSKISKYTTFNKWNGYNGLYNVLELTNASSSKKIVSLALFDINGKEGAVKKVTVPAASNLDIILNHLTGFSVDSYGVVGISAPNSIKSRVQFYKSDTKIDYVYTSDSTPALAYPSYFVVNEFYPGNASQKVSNVLSLSNLTDKESSVRVSIFDINGQAKGSTRHILKARSRVDIDVSAGVTKVGLVEVKSSSQGARYQASLLRLSQNASNNFGILENASAGSTKEIFVPIHSAAPWLELANVSNKAGSVKVMYYNGFSGTGSVKLVAERNYKLGARSQVHLNKIGDATLKDSGYLRIIARNEIKVLAQAVDYFVDNSVVVGAFASPYLQPTQTLVSSAYNTNLSAGTELSLINTSGVAAKVDVLFSSGRLVLKKTVELKSRAYVELTPAQLNLGVRKSGLVVVTPRFGSIAAELRRVSSAADPFVNVPNFQK